MLIPRIVPRMFSVGMMVFCPNVASGQSYPNKVIRIVTAEAGSGTDFVSRLIAPALSRSLGQQVIVDNRGSIGVEIVAKASPDGYTLLFYHSNLWLLPFMRDSMPYDPVKDFVPITLAVSAPAILVVHPSLPVTSVQGLIDLAKAKPGALNYGAASIGGPPHLAAELFKAMVGLDIVRINYKGAGSALTALIGGQVQLMFSSGGAVAAQVKSGRLRALATASAKPSALAPGLPTVATTVPGYEFASISGMFAPAGIPAALIKRLNQEFVRVLTQTDVKERLFNSGVEVVGSSPEEFAVTIRSEMTKMGKVIKDAGMRAD